MSALQLAARFTIHEGKLAEFKELAGRCMQSVREKDSGTLRYDWFIDSDGAQCVVQEAYRDSDALLEHIGNLGDTFGELLGVSDIAIELYGAPSEELLAATSGLAPRSYAHFQSI